MKKHGSQPEVWIKELGLQQHPEGGWYSEVYRSSGIFPGSALSEHNGDRPFMTSIYFMLQSGEVSRLHRLKSDEIWYHHAGGSLTVHQISAAGKYHAVRLGQNLTAGDRLQVVVQATVWFGATLNAEEAALVGCAVAPGFDFSDFELGKPEALIAQFPQHSALIDQLTV